MITRREKLRKFAKSTWHHIAMRERNAVPVFIFGEMRSGTNMLTGCLDGSWRTAVYNESDPDAFNKYELLDNHRIDGLIRESRATHVVFKCLADSYRAHDLLAEFSGSKGIWIFRNYADVVNSAIRKWSEHRQYLYYMLNDSEKASWRSRRLPEHLFSLVENHYARNIDDISARALIWYVRNYLFFDQNLQTHDRVLLVRYEDLAQNPGLVFQEVFRFLELPLRSSYFKAVSTRSIKRNPVPSIDPEVRKLCDSLQEKLRWHESEGTSHRRGSN